MRQQYGWVALYRRKNGEGEEGAWGRRLDAAAVYGATLTPLLFWHAHLPRRFQWFLQGDFLAGLPPAVARAAFVLYAAVFAAWAAKEIARARAGRRVSWGKVLVVLTTVATWFLGIVVFDSDYAFTVTNVFVHGIPYLGLVWFTSKARAEGRRAAGAPPAAADRWLASLPLFLLPLLAIAFAEEWGWDRLVWHDNPRFFPGAAAEPGRARAGSPRAAPRAPAGDALRLGRVPLEGEARERGRRRRAGDPVRPLGVHFLLDVAGAPFATLDDPVLVETLLVDAVKQNGREGPRHPHPPPEPAGRERRRRDLRVAPHDPHVARARRGRRGPLHVRRRRPRARRGRRRSRRRWAP